ncbi:zinc finger BED domain-containing protein 5-like [Octopus bimaculoides]|uniref:zinc finger BED domain-containing protein 5-like n=1 Tax=Octopus bimaculoides TaxID=37653 RepID=UPI00071CD528|nr:zinc finger BED domain-containing protein 5-like [Octopus bimaculoides]|eukprot:XP_014772365.1 PREDICTED: zinc finger BED domain-containing protein 5-like [Octopus bimaculoides]
MADLAQLCVYIRYVHNKLLENEFLFCETLNTRITATNIFQKVDQFFNTHGINWEHVVGMCTDGAPAMVGCRSGFQTMVKKSPNAIGTHCTLHRQGLMVKTMPDHLKNVLNDVVKAVNFIKANSLNSRLFTDLCKDNGSDFETLLLYLHVRWLSKGKVLKRVSVLRKEIHEFLRGAKNRTAQTIFQYSVPYMSFLFGRHF